jgi:hypothetical protein
MMALGSNANDYMSSQVFPARRSRTSEAFLDQYHKVEIYIVLFPLLQTTSLVYCERILDNNAFCIHSTFDGGQRGCGASQQGPRGPPWEPSRQRSSSDIFIRSDDIQHRHITICFNDNSTCTAASGRDTMHTELDMLRWFHLWHAIRRVGLHLFDTKREPAMFLTNDQMLR